MWAKAIEWLWRQWLRLRWPRLRWLRQRLSGPRAGIEPHPPLAGDRDARRLEQARFEAETRHAGRGPNPDAEGGREEPS